MPNTEKLLSITNLKKYFPIILAAVAVMSFVGGILMLAIPVARADAPYKQVLGIIIAVFMFLLAGLVGVYFWLNRDTEPNFFLTSRLNAYDGFPYPYGFGVHEGSLEPDLREPIQLINELQAEFNIPLINITMGNPYKNPHVNRPYARGGYENPENPVLGVARLLYGCRRAQETVPNVVCVATGMSYLRQFGAEIAAGLIETGGAKAAGWGRGSFAYPDFAKDVIEMGGMQKDKCCVTCGVCTKIMRQPTGRPGCPVRDTEWYYPEFRRVMRGK